MFTRKILWWRNQFRRMMSVCLFVCPGHYPANLTDMIANPGSTGISGAGNTLVKWDSGVVHGPAGNRRHRRRLGGQNGLHFSSGRSNWHHSTRLGETRRLMCKSKYFVQYLTVKHRANCSRHARIVGIHPQRALGANMGLRAPETGPKGLADEQSSEARLRVRARDVLAR